MYRRLLIISSLWLLPACGGDAQDNVTASAVEDLFKVTQPRASQSHPFDGVWVWGEGRPLYEIVVEDSQVREINALAADAPRVDYDRSKVDICPIDGLCSIQFIKDDPSGSTQQKLYMFTFTESRDRWWGYRGRAPNASGHFVVETRDMDLPLPRERMTAGKLRRRARID